MRKARKTDLKKILEIIEGAKKSLKKDGIDQWQIDPMGYDFLSGQIDKEKSYVYEENGEVLAYTFLSSDKEKSYDPIDDKFFGKNYITIHTFAVKSDQRCKNIGTKFLADIKSYAKNMGLDSIRIDTHEDNTKMLGLIKKFSFIKRGQIFIDEAGAKKPRIAYELIL